MWNVIFHVLPYYSVDKTQALDLGLFGITKQGLPKVRPGSRKSAQSNLLIRLISSWHIAATPKNIGGQELSRDGKRPRVARSRQSSLTKRIVRKKSTCMSKSKMR
jgi:hypothetical protein